METKEVEVSSLIKMVAAQRILHTPIDTIITELKLTKYRINKLMATKEYKEVLKEMSDEATSHAVSVWKASVSDLVSESHRVIKEKLKQNDLKAVEIVLKSIGVEATENVTAPTSIQVILPPGLGDTARPVDIIVESNNDET